MSADRVMMVHTTCPDSESGRRLAAALVELRLAACVSMGSAAVSVYPWQGAIETERELPLTIKTTAAALPALKAALVERHPYEVPELLAVEVADGLDAYLEWTRDWVNEKD